MVSFGSGGKSKSKGSSESGTRWKQRFFDKAIDYFGGDPGFEPGDFSGFEDFDKLESNLYESQARRLGDEYNSAVSRRREELSLAGLLNSPNQFLENGARASLDSDYLKALQAAAGQASLGRLSAQQDEYGRRNEWNQQNALARLNAFLSKLGLAISAGRYSKSSNSSSGGGGFGFELSNPFKPIDLN